MQSNYYQTVMMKTFNKMVSVKICQKLTKKMLVPSNTVTHSGQRALPWNQTMT